MTGLEYMKAIVDGSHARAPIQELMGFDIVEAEEGRTGDRRGIRAQCERRQAARARHLHLHDPLTERWLTSAG